MVTVSVGPDEEGFAIHKNVLTAMVGDGVLTAADLSNEKPKTFQAFVTWMYVAFLHVSHLSSPLYLPVELDLLLELYVFAYAHHINDLQDVIISVLYEKFAKDGDLWHTLGSDKSALETLVRVVPPDTHLYRLVIRSLAYSMRLQPEHYWLQSDVEEVMESVPSELWGAISKEILLIKTRGPRQDFGHIVGSQMRFLKLYEDWW